MTPENLPHKQILNDAIPYLGKIYSGPVKLPKQKNVNYDNFKYSGKVVV